MKKEASVSILSNCADRDSSQTEAPVPKPSALLPAYRATPHLPIHRIGLWDLFGNGRLARLLLFVVLGVMILTSPVLASSGFEMPCVGNDEGGAMRFYLQHVKLGGGDYDSNLKYFYASDPTQIGPDHASQPWNLAGGGAEDDIVVIKRRATYEGDIGWHYKHGINSSFSPLPNGPADIDASDTFIADFIGGGCSSATNSMQGILDYAMHGSNGSFSDEMDGLFAFIDEHPHRYCWAGLEFLLENPDQNGNVAGATLEEIHRDGSGCATANPVTFSNGAVRLSVQDLEGLREDDWFGHRRSYTNRMAAPYLGPNGNNWLVHTMPYVAKRSEGADIFLAVMLEGARAVWFKEDNGGWVPAFGEEHVSLTHDATAGEYVLTEHNGLNTPGSRSAVVQWKFHDLDQAADRKGLLKQRVDAGGDVVGVLGYSSGQVTGLQRTLRDGTLEKIEYAYYDSTSVNDRRLKDATFTRKPAGQTNWVNVSQAGYTYYGDSEANGSLNDLKTVTQQQHINGSWAPVATTYYRYWKAGQLGFITTGFTHGLKYVVDPAAYQRMVADGIADPLNASDIQVADYADNYFEYSSLARYVTKEVASAGCAGCGGGDGTAGDVFSDYLHNPGNFYTDDFNHWKIKTTVTHPDNFQEVVYTNYAGQVLMRVYRQIDAATPIPQWAYFYTYDAQGRLAMSASPSAIALTDLATHETHLDLLNKANGNYQYLKDTPSGSNEGLILTHTYDPTSGQLSARKVQQGELGTPITLEAFEYQSASVNGHTLYPLTKHKAYPVAGGSAVETLFAYDEWHTVGTQVKRKTTTLPAIPTAQNGPGGATGATIEEWFDEDGNVTWQKDERGVITYFKHQTDLNVLEQRIDDVDMNGSGLPSSKPSWTTPTGGGKHLVADFEYDDLGRPTRTLGAAHEVEVSGSAQTVRSATWNIYLINGVSSDNEIRSASGYLNGGTEVVVDPVTVQTQDKAGQLTEQIAVARGVSSPLTATENLSTTANWRRRTVTTRNKKNQVESVTVYHDIANNQSTQTKFAYDDMGRRSRVESPDGTVTRTIYDGRGRVTETWIGTDDGCECGVWDPATENVNMTRVIKNQYDDQDNLTQTTAYASDTDSRITTYAYDWRNRRVTEDGEEDRFAQFTYDNLDRLTQIDRHDTTETGTLIARHETRYDDLGRVYQTTTHAVDPANGNLGNSLTSNTWYDPSGNVIKTQPGGTQRFTKHAYDSLGRLATTYEGYDTAENTHAQAGDVSGDTVLQQVKTQYDNAGNTLQVTTYDRHHSNTSATGALTSSTARVSYQAFWYDGLDRQIASADYGTNDGAAFSRPSTIPARADTVLVNSLTYNDAGDVETQTDPKGIQTRLAYDHAGRLTKTVENYINDDPTDGNADEDRTTTFTYTPDSQIKTQTAKMPNPADDQTTTYVYGVDTSSGSDLASNRLLRATIYPDSDDTDSPLGDGPDTTYDRVEMKYNRLGQLIERKDQRQTVHTMDYDKLGRVVHDRVTGLGSADGSVRRITRSYEVRGMLASIASYDSEAPGSGSVLDEATFDYNMFGQLTEDHQEHSGPVDTSTPKVTYAYEDGSDMTKGIRPTTITYPNGRTIHRIYEDTALNLSPIDNQISRAVGLAEDDGLGGPSSPITYNEYLGSGLIAVKHIRNPIRLDYTDGVSATYSGYDRFNRIATQWWAQHYGSGSTAYQFDLFRIRHGYDRNGNRLFATRHSDTFIYTPTQVHRSFSQFYTYDGLNRITDFHAGQAQLDTNGNPLGTIDPYWQLNQRSWTLDPRGNPTQVIGEDNKVLRQSTPDPANQLGAHQARAASFRKTIADTFTSDSSASWTSIGPGDAFTVDNNNSNTLEITTVVEDSTDEEPRAVLLLGEAIGPLILSTSMVWPVGTPDGAEAGIVFGYESEEDYYLIAHQYNSTGSFTKLYWVTNGARVELASAPTTITLGSSFRWLTINPERRAIWSPVMHSFPDGVPPGRVGLYANKPTEFNHFYGYDHATPRDWNRYDTTNSLLYARAAEDDLWVGNAGTSYGSPLLVRGVYSNRFEAIFHTKPLGAGGSVRFFLNATDDDDMDIILMHLSTSPVAPYFYETQDGQLQQSVTRTGYWSNLPASTASDTWWRVTADGTTVRVYAQAATTQPTTWSDTAHLVASCDNLDMAGGYLGFTGGAGANTIDDLTIRIDTNADGSYDTTQLIDGFTVDADKDFSDTLTHDAAGNLTYDGVFAYTYDAWNRLTKVAKAYRDPGSGTLQTGSVLATYRYDGLGRRIVRQFTHCADRDATYHDYYDSSTGLPSLVETRNGSDMVLKQYLWSNLTGQYADELAQIMINGDPVNDPNFDPADPEHDARAYYPLHDANYNILGLVDGSDGDLIERYEYTPYGQRTVYFQTNANTNTSPNAPTFTSRRVVTADGVTQPYGLCEFGHQGLMHDEPLPWSHGGGLIYNRARMLHPRLGRFLQRDPLGYVDGFSLYEYVRSSPIRFTDPRGTESISDIRRREAQLIAGATGDRQGVSDTLNAANRAESMGNALAGAQAGLNEASRRIAEDFDPRDPVNVATEAAVAAVPAARPLKGTAKRGIKGALRRAKDLANRALDKLADCVRGGKGTQAGRKTTQESASELANQLGRNRVSGRTAGGKQVDIDLQGKGHFDKASGQTINTPHVHEADINIGPNGHANLSNKTTRPATAQDVRNAKRLSDTN